MIDKNNIIPGISSKAPVVLELGVGDRKRKAESIGIDVIDTSAADIVGDALEILRTLPAMSVREISSAHFFEHITYLPAILQEVERVLAVGGSMRVMVPHFSNPFYYSDPTHVNVFGLYTFSYYCEDRVFRRKVPRYVSQSGLELIAVKLVFKSFSPRYLAHGVRKIFQGIFNLSNFTKEIYEDSFSNLISCYEIEYTIRKI